MVGMVACLNHMTLTTHALVGAAAASFFPAYPYAAFAAGFVSHFAIDALPHYDYGEYLRALRWDEANNLRPSAEKSYVVQDLLLIGADALLGFVLTFVAAWVLGIPAWLALIGAGAALYPDLLQVVHYVLRDTEGGWALGYLQRFHSWVQSGEEHPEWGWRKGFALQLLLVVGVFIAVKLLQ